ncbi:MAG: LptF/LptG family permease [Pseudomonadota bacterium]
MNRLNRYLFFQTLIGVVGAAAVVLAVILLIDFVETSRDIATRADISAPRVFALTLMRAPLLVQDTLPFIMLFGVLWAFFRLNRRSEFIVMRASGFSAWGMAAAPVTLAVVIGAFGALALNPLGAASNAAFERERERLLEGRTGQETRAEGPVWLREGRSDGYVLITAEGLDADGNALDRPTFRVYSTTQGSPQMDRRIDADRAVLSSGFWTLANALERRAGAEAIQLGQVSVPTQIGRQALFERARSPIGVSFWRMPEVITSAREAGLSTRAYELRWQGMLALPLMLAAAALVAVAATLRLARLGGAAGFALAGGLSGFLLYFTQQLFLSLGSAGAMEPITAAWTAPALFVLAGLAYIAQTEDG